MRGINIRPEMNSSMLKQYASNDISQTNLEEQEDTMLSETMKRNLVMQSYVQNLKIQSNLRLNQNRFTKARKMLFEKLHDGNS